MMNTYIGNLSQFLKIELSSKLVFEKKRRAVKRLLKRFKGTINY